MISVIVLAVDLATIQRGLFLTHPPALIGMPPTIITLPPIPFGDPPSPLSPRRASSACRTIIAKRCRTVVDKSCRQQLASHQGPPRPARPPEFRHFGLLLSREAESRKTQP